ncbi:MAG: hypothetical protein ACTSPI_01340 [Candidatus Heimdallarchaeaceae archaeon]
MKEEQRESEFGKGLTYCLGLFLCHSERDYNSIEDDLQHELWFNGAGDHLFELVIPKNLSIKLKNRLKKLQKNVLNWRMSNATKNDKVWAIQEAKELLRLIDEFYGIKTIKGSWE